MHLPRVGGAVIHVGAALIPDESPAGHRRERRHHAVPHLAAGRNPWFKTRSTPADIHEPHRHVDGVVNGEGVVEADGGDKALRPEADRHARVGILERLGGEVAPDDLLLQVRRLRLALRRRVEADVASAGEGRHGLSKTVAVTRVAAEDGVLHVALPRGKPHLAHQHVRDLPLADHERTRFLARRHRVEIDAPASIRAGGAALGLPGERDGYALARLGRSPHRHAHAALQHHVVGERRSRYCRRTRRHTCRGHRRADDCLCFHCIYSFKFTGTVPSVLPLMTDTVKIYAYEFTESLDKAL